jgi:NAD kinase
MYEKIVVITRKTRLQELIERFNTHAQAKFYIEHSGGDFAEYEQEHGNYEQALAQMQRSLELGLKLQCVDRSFVPTFLFTPKDVIVTLGQDGLVANTAKYVNGQPIIAVNPDPSRFDGVLLPFLPKDARAAVHQVMEGKQRVRAVTLAEVQLNDGQHLLAFNDLFLGARTHVSARYRLTWQGRGEPQSSSGVIVSTGAGSTGWMSSVFNMASGVARLAGGKAPSDLKSSGLKMSWEDPRLLFVVREPFVSRHSQANIVAGLVTPEQSLCLESLMPSGGVIFSDGVEADFLEFNSGAVATIHAAAQKAQLVIG